MVTQRPPRQMVRAGEAASRTSARASARLHCITGMGTVSFCATTSGMPTWSTSIWLSGLITERAEKSTRLPMRKPRKRPSLPFSRAMRLLVGRPERCTDCRWPRSSLLMSVETWKARSFTACWAARLSPTRGMEPRSLCSTACTLALAFRISTYLAVRSSWPRAAEPSEMTTEGRTTGGGTTSTESTKCSGRESGLRPSSAQSSSRSVRRMDCTSLAVKGRLQYCSSSGSANFTLEKSHLTCWPCLLY